MSLILLLLKNNDSILGNIPLTKGDISSISLSFKYNFSRQKNGILFNKLKPLLDKFLFGLLMVSLLSFPFDKFKSTSLLVIFVSKFLLKELIFFLFDHLLIYLLFLLILLFLHLF